MIVDHFGHRARSDPHVPGMLLAGATAVTSGVAVFVNSYAVHSFRDAAVYTTAKNLVATLLLVAWVGSARIRSSAIAVNFAQDRDTRATGGRWLSLGYVGVFGGGVAFVMFFEGLARMTAEPAAFLHDTLVIWVALLAVPALGEMPSAWNIAAISVLVCGQIALSGGIGHVALGEGAALVLGATMLWSIETVVAKRILGVVDPRTLALARMGIGAVVLVGFVALTGHWSTLIGIDSTQLGWVLLTGGLLAVYVGTWMSALSWARAVDVTSVLVFSVVVTSILQLLAGGVTSSAQWLGLSLVVLGTLGALRAWPRPALT